MGTLLSNNIKFLRKKLSLTQEQFAERLSIKRSLVGAYEEGRAEPGISNLLKISQVFEVSVDNLISEDYTELNAETKLIRKDIDGKRLRVLSVKVDKDDNEKIILIPHKAAAGYLNGYSDTEYIETLPSFHLPIFTNGTFRAFEIKGDSMLPLLSGTFIIGQYVENWFDIRDDKTYIFVTRNEGIVYKRATNLVKSEGIIVLKSDNPGYKPYNLNIDDLLEAWEAKAYLSTELPTADMSINNLASMVHSLKEEISGIKGSFK